MWHTALAEVPLLTGLRAGALSDGTRLCPSSCPRQSQVS